MLSLDLPEIPGRRTESLWDPTQDDLPRLYDVHAPLAFEHPNYIAAEAAGRFNRISSNGVRANFSTTGGSGFADIVRFDHGIEMQVVNNLTPTMRRGLWQSDEPLIIVRAALSGHERLRVDGAPPVVLDRPELTVLCITKGMAVTFERLGGMRQQNVTAIFALPAFAAAYRLKPADLPPPVREVMDGKVGFGRLMSIPLEPRIADMVADTIDTTLDGELRSLQYAGRLSELVAYTFDVLRDPVTEPAHCALSWRDADLAHLLVARLARDYLQPPSVDELAQELGATAKKLQTSFKSAFGMTMVQYCLERRMRDAQKLLLEGRLSIGAVGERLGYSHQSSFAAAFAGFAGMSPREYRRHRAPIYRVLR